MVFEIGCGNMTEYRMVHIADIYELMQNVLGNIDEYKLLKILKAIGAKTDNEGNIELIKEYDGIYVEVPTDIVGDIDG